MRTELKKGHLQKLQLIHAATEAWRKTYTPPGMLQVARGARDLETERAAEVWPTAVTGVRIPVITK